MRKKVIYKHKKRIAVAALVIVALALCFFLFLHRGVPREGASEVAIYQRDSAGLARNCAATKKQEVAVPGGSDPIAFAIEALLADNLSELKPSFEKVTVIGNTARLYFKTEALQYLNGPACLQQSYKVPLEKTLEQFDNVTRVEYYINKELFTEWDA